MARPPLPPRCDTPPMPIDGLHDRLAPLPRERTQALPALHLLHDLAGYLPPDGLEQIGHWLHIPNSDLYAVATSYTEFRSHPAEPGVVGVCRGLSCRLAGGDALLAELRAAGRRVEERECLFACAVAPVIDDTAAAEPLSGHATPAPPAPAPAPVPPTPAPPDPTPHPARTPTPEIARPRLNLHTGSMAHALGAAAVLDTLRHAPARPRHRRDRRRWRSLGGPRARPPPPRSQPPSRPTGHLRDRRRRGPRAPQPPDRRPRPAELLRRPEPPPPRPRRPHRPHLLRRSARCRRLRRPQDRPQHQP